MPGSSWIPAQPGPIARFRLVVPFLGVRISLTYEVIRFVPDREVLLHASNGVLQATDRIVVTGTADGSTASYDTEMRLRGTLQVLAPARGQVSAVAVRAAAGRAQALSGRPPGPGTTAPPGTPVRPGGTAPRGRSVTASGRRWTPH